MRNIKSASNFYLLVTVISVMIFLYSIFSGSDLPFVGYHAFNFNVYSLIAHNYNEFGLWATKVAPIISTTPILPDSPTYYLHHPPMISIVESILFRVFGESFFVARLSVILFSLTSVGLIYLIGTELVDKKFGLVAVSVACLMPATSLFGKMVGQEALVLTFCLSSLLFLLKYLKSEKKLYLFLLILSIILGTLSDWPMVYFIAALFPYLYHRKRLNLFLVLISVAVTTAGLYLLYIFLILNSYQDLIKAFFVRSFDAYGITALWYFKWLILLMLRFVVYFNPLIILASLIGVWQVLMKKLKFYTAEGTLLFSLCLFGVIHIVMYPAGSFGHPYWIYYLLPGIVFLAARVLYQFPKVLIMAIVIFSLLYSIKVVSWKTGEIQANVWRYDLAAKVAEFVPKYSTIASNLDPAVDIDALRYAFLINTELVLLSELDEDHSYYLVSCVSACNQNVIRENIQLWQHEVVHSKVAEGEMYLFYLDSPISQQRIPVIENTVIETEVDLQRGNSTVNFKTIYTEISSWLGAPQI